MRAIIVCVLCLIGEYSIAQNKVNIRFNNNGEHNNLKDDFHVSIVNDRDTTVFQTINDSVIIPSSMSNEIEVSLIFQTHNYSLVFSDCRVMINPQYPVWEIGVLNSPFSKKEMRKFWMVKKWKKIKQVYYLDNGMGELTTVTKSW